MTYLLSILFLISIISNGADNQMPQLLLNEMQMPTKAVLEERLHSYGLISLKNHTKLIDKVADKHKSPFAVTLDIKQELAKIKHKLHKPLLVCYNDHYIFSAIFKEHPEIRKAFDDYFYKSVDITEKKTNKSAWDKPLQIK